MKKIQKQVKTLIHRHGSREKLAVELMVTASYVYMLERGVAIPSDRLARDIQILFEKVRND